MVPPDDSEPQMVTAEDDRAAWAAYDLIYIRRGTVVEVMTTRRPVPPPKEKPDATENR